jgi:hypothetical protein
LALEISENWFGDMETATIAVESATGDLEIRDNSIQGARDQGIRLTAVTGADLAGNRIRGAADASDTILGITVTEGKDIVIGDTWLWSLRDGGIRVSGSDAVSLEGLYVAGSSGAAVRIDGSGEGTGIAVTDAVLVGSLLGLEAYSSRVEVRDVQVGGSTRQGLKFRECPAAEVHDSVISGSGSTGVEMTLMDGTESTVFDIRGNVLHESRGVGILVRSGGAGLFSVQDNHVIGTRPGVVVNAEDQSGTVGDGIALLTGTDGTASRAELSGNILDGNVRLGIIAHGAGTWMTIQDSTFGSGNGWGGYLEGRTDGVPDLLWQEGAEVTGPDAGLASALDQSIQVASDVSLGGGGDPH